MFNRIPSSSSGSWISPDSAASAAADAILEPSSVAPPGPPGKRKQSGLLPQRTTRSVSQRSEGSRQPVLRIVQKSTADILFIQRPGPGNLDQASAVEPSVATVSRPADGEPGRAFTASGYRAGTVVTSGRTYGPADAMRSAVATQPSGDDYGLNLPDDVRADIRTADVTGLLNICRRAVRCVPGFSRAVLTHAAGEMPRCRASGAEIGELFDYLRTAIANIHPTSMSFAPMIALTSQFADPRCASRAVSFGQERAFLALQIDIERVADIQCRDILKARWTAGVWMVNDPGLRGLLWTTMWQQRDNSTRRVELVEALSHSLKYLPQNQQMEGAYAALVDITPALPAAAQSIVLCNLVHVLACPQDAALRDAEFRALLTLAKRLPDELGLTVRIGLCDLLPLLSPEQRRNQFIDLASPDIGIGSAGGEALLHRLSSCVPQLLPAARPTAWKLLFDRLTSTVPGAQRARLANALLRTIPSLPTEAMRDDAIGLLREDLAIGVQPTRRNSAPGSTAPGATDDLAGAPCTVGPADNRSPAATESGPDRLDADLPPAQSETSAIEMAQALRRLPTLEALVDALEVIRQRGHPQWDVHHPEILLVMTKLIPLMFEKSKLSQCLATITRCAHKRGPEPLTRVVQAIENEMVDLAKGLGTDILHQRASPALAYRFEQLLAASAQMPIGLGPRWAAAVSDVLDSAAQQQSPCLHRMLDSCGNHLSLPSWPERVCEHALQF